MIQLGSTCKDRVTGFTGVAIARIEAMGYPAEYRLLSTAEIQRGEYPISVDLPESRVEVVGRYLAVDGLDSRFSKLPAVELKEYRRLLDEELKGL